MRLGVPEFIKARRTENSLAQDAGSLALRTTPRGILALLKGTLKGVDNLIIRLVPDKCHMPTAARATGILSTGATLGYLLPIGTSALDGGLTAAAVIAVNKLGPKAAALLDPEKRAKIDKAVLDKLAYIHSIGDRLCGKDQGVYAQQMDLYTDYAVKRERFKVQETLDRLLDPANKSRRDEFFGPENKESKIAMQIFNLLSRSHVEEVRDKALAVLAERVKDYSPTDTALIDQVRDYHKTRTADGFVAILEGAKSLDRKDIHHMFGDRASSLIFVYNALLHDQEFSNRLIATTEGILKSDKKFAKLTEVQSTALRNVRNKDMIKTVEAKQATDTLIARIEKLTKGLIQDVNSNASETALIANFNSNLLSPPRTGDFKFSIAEFFANMDSSDPAVKVQAIEKLLAARSILEFQKVQESIKVKPNEDLIESNAHQQALMLALVHDPSSLGIDDAKKTLQRNIDSFWKSAEGQELIADHSVQIAAIHYDNRNHQVDKAIKEWNADHPAEVIWIISKDEANIAFLDRQMTYRNDLDAAARALMPKLTEFLGDGTTALDPKYKNLAQSLELLANRQPDPESTDALIKRVITDDTSIIKDLNSSDTKTTAVFKLLVGIRNSGLELELRDDAYSFVAKQLGSNRALKEVDLLGRTSEPYILGYNADVNAVKLADLLELKASDGTPVGNVIHNIITVSLPSLITELKDTTNSDVQKIAVIKLSELIGVNPRAIVKDVNSFLKKAPDIKWDIMNSIYSDGTTNRSTFAQIESTANNLSDLEKHSRKIDGDIAKDALEPLLSDLFIKTQTVNPGVDPRNMRSTTVMSQVKQENKHQLTGLEALVNENITNAIDALATYHDRTEIAYLGFTREIMDSVFKKAIV